MRREGARREDGRSGENRTFNKLPHSEGDKHRVPSVSDFHCESSKPEGSSLRRQLFHGVGRTEEPVFSHFLLRRREFFFPRRRVVSRPRFQRRKCKIHWESSGALIRVLDSEEKENRRRNERGSGARRASVGNIGVDSVKRATASFSQPDDGNILLSATILRAGSKGPTAIAKGLSEKWSKGGGSRLVARMSLFDSRARQYNFNTLRTATWRIRKAR